LDNYVTNATSIRGGSSYYWKVGGTLLVISFLPVWRTQPSMNHELFNHILNYNYLYIA
jgi:hypothetical protein